ncbi:unnamed protein product [Musa acuminata subsp. burmannicoides]
MPGDRRRRRCPIRRGAAPDHNSAGGARQPDPARPRGRAASGGEHGADDRHGRNRRSRPRAESPENWFAHHCEPRILFFPLFNRNGLSLRSTSKTILVQCRYIFSRAGYRWPHYECYWGTDR